jgi:hypothetical protein
LYLTALHRQQKIWGVAWQHNYRTRLSGFLLLLQTRFFFVTFTSMAEGGRKTGWWSSCTLFVWQAYRKQLLPCFTKWKTKQMIANRDPLIYFTLVLQLKYIYFLNGQRRKVYLFISIPCGLVARPLGSCPAIPGSFPC